VVAQSAQAFTEAEVRAIASHGPWPPAFKADPSNRVSGNAAAVELGERLFFERRLSANGEVSCSRCHLPERNWTDGEARALGLARVDRNTPSLNNVRLQRWFGWDGANDSLWAQSIRPILDARELGMSAGQVAKLVRGDRDLSCRYSKVFGTLPAEDEKVLVDVGKALAAFQETLSSRRTAFDEFRDALVKGDQAGVAKYPEAAKRGLSIFFGKFNLLGTYNDDRGRASATSTKHVVLEHRNFGEFKTPSLRNLALTAPYMHNGRLATLRDVVQHYSNISPDRLHSDGEAILKPLKLSEREAQDLLAFLESLQDGGGNYRRKALAEDCG
jgi:cytochrome c peroxidase